MSQSHTLTEEQFTAAMTECRSLFEKKLHDYGASWRLLRPSSLTDQLFIKAMRIRSLEVTGTTLVGEGIRPEFIALVNYGLVGLIQLEVVQIRNDGSQCISFRNCDSIWKLVYKKRRLDLECDSGYS